MINTLVAQFSKCEEKICWEGKKYLMEVLIKNIYGYSLCIVLYAAKALLYEECR